MFVESSSSAAQLGNTDTIVCGEAELALMAMDRQEWDQAEQHYGLPLQRSTSTGCTTTSFRCWRSLLLPGSLCTAATERTRTGNSLERCEADRRART